jgi:fructose-bisphosphate aldolase, class II
MAYASTQQLIERACEAGVVIPAFNIPYLPMVEPVVKAIKDTNSVGLVMAARLEWEKFETGSLEALRDEYEKFKLPRHTRLHLDHVPVIDEDDLRVDFMDIINRAIKAGYESVMVDGSRLSFAENAACTKEAADAAHAAGIPIEAELGAVMGHESGPLPPYEELFASGKGFTDPDEARQFADQSGCDWLSVAIGNIHGAISAAAKGKKKVAARLNIEHLDRIHKTTDIPLVLHGGTGIRKEYIMDSMQHGIAKINVATATRQPYEAAIANGIEAAQQAVYDAMLVVIKDDLEVQDSANILNPEEVP